MLASWNHAIELIDPHALDIEAKFHCIPVKYILLDITDPILTF